jgi:hypothetical protein
LKKFPTHKVRVCLSSSNHPKGDVLKHIKENFITLEEGIIFTKLFHSRMIVLPIRNKLFKLVMKITATPMNPMEPECEVDRYKSTAHDIKSFKVKEIGGEHASICLHFADDSFEKVHASLKLSRFIRDTETSTMSHSVNGKTIEMDNLIAKYVDARVDRVSASLRDNGSETSPKRIDTIRAAIT